MKKVQLIAFLCSCFSLLLNAQNTVVDIIVQSEDHETLETAVLAAGLETTLSGDGPFTVFAPTDDAFAAIPAETLTALLADPMGDLTDILLYHVLDGDIRSADLTNGQVATTKLEADAIVRISMDTIMINNAVITVEDIVADNGVVHVIDAVLLPPAGTVVDVIVNSDVHETLETAVVAAGLVDALNGEGPFTVFAPTDDAFAAIPDTTLTALLDDPTGQLAQILQYHVVNAEAYASDLSNGQIIETLIGENVKVTINDSGVFINDAQVTVTDILATNGTVHVIDAVLLPPSGTVVDVIVNSDVHETLETAVVAAGLVDALNGEGPFTVFAPTDDAFAAIPDTTLTALLDDPTGQLAQILQYHVVNAEAYASDLSNGQIIETLIGENVKVTINDSGVFINDAQVTVTDILATNGTVHVIDAVLLPPAGTVVDVIVNSDVHETLETAVVAAGLVDALSGEGPFTVFAPTDDAFAAIPDTTLTALLDDPTGQLAQILQYHVVNAEAYASDLSNGQIIETLIGENVKVTINDSGVFINDAQVTVTDILATNGTVHVIDAVLLPPAGTVVDVIVNSDVHETLETAVVAAGLVDALSGEGPFTVFAPTDDAFAAIPDTTLTALLDDPTGQLAQILQYHVVNAEAYASDLSNGQIIETLIGENVKVTINDSGVFINDAQVTVTDILATNGTVHVIDAVLLPPAGTVVDVIVNSDVHETLETAVVAAGLVDALSGEGPFTVFAPTDDAFAALGQETINALLADPTGDLAGILQYHVANGEAYAIDFVDGQLVPTLQGGNLTLTVDMEGVFINNAFDANADAKVIVSDIFATNGVVHVIDAVLNPATTSTRGLDLINDEINVFPNPANGAFQITGSETLAPQFDLKLMDLSGRVLKTWQEITWNQPIFVNDLPGGIYLLQINAGNKIGNKKITIQN